MKQIKDLEESTYSVLLSRFNIITTDLDVMLAQAKSVSKDLEDTFLCYNAAMLVDKMTELQDATEEIVEQLKQMRGEV